MRTPEARQTLVVYRMTLRAGQIQREPGERAARLRGPQRRPPRLPHPPALGTADRTGGREAGPRPPGGA